MIVVVVLVAAMIVAGGLGGAAVLWWPGRDPASPRVAARIARWELREHPAFVRRRLDPTSTSGLALTVGAGAVVLGGVVFAAMAAMVATATGLAPSDQPIERWADAQSTETVMQVLDVVTDLASTPIVAVILVLVGFVELRRLPSWQIVTFLVVVAAGQAVIITLLKALADRARPELNPIAESLGPSFPSGHAASAAACFAAAALLLGRRRSPRTRAGIVGLAVGLAVGVATTRVLLGVHWLTDAIAGLAVGWTWFTLVAIAFGGRLLRLGTPLELAERTEALGEALERPGR